MVWSKDALLLQPVRYLEFVMKRIQDVDSGVIMGSMCLNNICNADTTLLETEFENMQISTHKLEAARSVQQIKGTKIKPTK